MVDTGLNKLGAIIGTNCKTGANASIMPGARLGPNSIVGSYLCLTRDLGRDRVLLAQPSYQIEEKEGCVE